MLHVYYLIHKNPYELWRTGSGERKEEGLWPGKRQRGEGPRISILMDINNSTDRCLTHIRDAAHSESIVQFAFQYRGYIVIWTLHVFNTMRTLQRKRGGHCRAVRRHITLYGNFTGISSGGAVAAVKLNASLKLHDLAATSVDSV